LRFCALRRNDLFPDAPRILTGEQRLVRGLPLNARDAIVAPRSSLMGQIELILQVLPHTEQVAVVFGNSPSERFWASEFREQLAPLAGKLRLLWLNDHSVDQMQSDVAALGEQSAIFYGMLTVDTAGIPYEGKTALSLLRAATKAPIFGVFEDDLGHGIVGGMLVSEQQLGSAMGEVAADGQRRFSLRSGPLCRSVSSRI
jgi:hypothetical protein